MTKKRRLVRVITNPIIIALVVIATYFLIPVSLGNTISNGANMAITYTDMSFTNAGSPIYKTSEFHFASDSKEFQDIVALLQQYSYHHSYQSLYNNTNLEGITQSFIISTSSSAAKGEVNYLHIGNAPKIIVNNSVCRVGYLGNATILKLHKELKSILNIE